MPVVHDSSAAAVHLLAALDNLETIVARAQDMTEFLRESELSERKVFAKTFVREIVVMPGKALIHYNVPMPGDGHSPGADSEEVPLNISAKSASKTPG